MILSETCFVYHGSFPANDLRNRHESSVWGTFHELLETFTIPDSIYATRGLTDILLSHDTKLLYVGIPDPVGGNGILYVIKVTDPGEPTLLTTAEAKTRFVDVGPEPFRFTRTDDRNVIVVVDRTSSHPAWCRVNQVRSGE